MSVGSCAHLYYFPDPPVELYLVDEHYRANWLALTVEITVFYEHKLDRIESYFPDPPVQLYHPEYFSDDGDSGEVFDPYEPEPDEVREAAINGEIKKPFLQMVDDNTQRVQAPHKLLRRDNPLKSVPMPEEPKKRNCKGEILFEMAANQMEQASADMTNNPEEINEAELRQNIEKTEKALWQAKFVCSSLEKKRKAG